MKKVSSEKKRCNKYRALSILAVVKAANVLAGCSVFGSAEPATPQLTPMVIKQK
ncbi:hypothetical protein [Paenibacillus ferrarius]|uniref:hypothetical protein n=1 Tax=Paenibacillus ferrarius TaxID=1469647 RepID=UPI0013020AF7|nr:hypothetical protein [Paenibacillus ferrarius]